MGRKEEEHRARMKELEAEIAAAKEAEADRCVPFLIRTSLPSSPH